MVLINPSYRDLLKMALPNPPIARAVIMGEHIGVAPADGLVHADIVKVMRNHRIPVTEPYMELFVDASFGDFTVACTSKLPEDCFSWRKHATKRQQQVLDDLCKILGEGSC